MTVYLQDNDLVEVNAGMKYNVPVAVPECGYDNLGCDKGADALNRKIASGVLLFCFILFFFTGILKYRNWKYELEISGLSWRIEMKELTFYNWGHTCNVSGSRVCRGSQLLSRSSSMNSKVCAVLNYRGC